MTNTPKHRHSELRIAGMTCSSCELLLERKLKHLPGMVQVDVNHRTGVAHLTARADQLPDQNQIISVITDAGYRLADGASTAARGISNQRAWVEIGGSLLIIFAVYKLLQAADFASLAPSMSGTISLGGALVIGLVAGASSCLAVTGGLLVALAAKHNELHQAETPRQKFKPLLHFNVGRLVSYLLLGGLVGVLGQSTTLSTRSTGYMNMAVALIMLYLGLSILGVMPRGSFPIRPPKKLSRWIANLSESEHPAAPFALGAFTFFLPCGFTQSLQIVALASGSFVAGATTMFVFALGTLPSLLGISAVSSLANGNFSRLFLRFSGALVLLLAVFNLISGFALTGLDLSRVLASGTSSEAAAPAPLNGEIQEVSLKVTSAGYQPNSLTIKGGVPVRWRVDGSGAFGCTSILTIPALGIRQSLTTGENIIEFTASNRGQLAFMCSMGMVRGSFTVI